MAQGALGAHEEMRRDVEGMARLWPRRRLDISRARGHSWVKPPTGRAIATGSEVMGQADRHVYPCPCRGLRLGQPP